ncbi:MAG: hypothetical protein ABTQ73_08805 [Caldilineales bacterium]
MDPDTRITIITVDDSNSRRGELSRVAEQISAGTLRQHFSEFMQAMQTAFSADELATADGQFELSEIQFSAELSTAGEFKLLGSGVGAAATAALTFTLTRKHPANA